MRKHGLADDRACIFPRGRIEFRMGRVFLYRAREDRCEDGKDNSNDFHLSPQNKGFLHDGSLRYLMKLTYVSLEVKAYKYVTGRSENKSCRFLDIPLCSTPILTVRTCSKRSGYLWHYSG